VAPPDNSTICEPLALHMGANCPACRNRTLLQGCRARKVKPGSPHSLNILAGQWGS
jgi:hypothetical protein